MAFLLRELTLLQRREGWLSEEGLREIAGRLGLPLHRLEGLSTFYTHFRRTPPKGIQVRVCRDLSCSLGGGEAAAHRLREAVAGRDDVEVHEVSCLGRCDGAPAAVIGDRVVSTADTPQVLAVMTDAAAARAGSIEVIPSETQSAATHWGEAEVYPDRQPRYEALRAALSRDRADLSRTLEESGLRGMGGAGFPTGRKWSLVATEPATPKYVICNADESEPGTFKDREILRSLPHLVIEGIALAAYCVGAKRGYVFIRHEYEPERRALAQAISEAQAVGALGSNVFGSDFNLELEVFVSPGGYILGEETALLECMEDHRGEPRNRPPFPGTSGLHGQPTLINNVETLAHATGIVKNGAQWWRALAAPGFAGHKFISVSGDVARPGVVLVPFGTTIGELLERCGGMKDGRALAAVAPGGASSSFLPPDCLDVHLDFKALSDAGSMLGSGAAVFIAEGHDLLEVGLNVTRFFRNESCGKCVPCRVGSEKAVKMLEGEGRHPATRHRCVTAETRALLGELHSTMAQTSICGLGQVALGPVLSIIDNVLERSAGGDRDEE